MSVSSPKEATLCRFKTYPDGKSSDTLTRCLSLYFSYVDRKVSCRQKLTKNLGARAVITKSPVTNGQIKAFSLL